MERRVLRYFYTVAREEDIAMTPYSALAGGRLSKRPGRPLHVA